MWSQVWWLSVVSSGAGVFRNLDGRGVDVELLEDGEGLLKELVADGDVGDVGGVVVVQAVDVLHDARAVCLDGRQDQKVLEISAEKKSKINAEAKQDSVFCEV